MRLALLFSGQGGQGPQHLVRVARQAPAALRPALELALPFLDEASEIPAERLQENRYAQPLIFALQMTFWEQLRTRLPRPICAAGSTTMTQGGTGLVFRKLMYISTSGTVLLVLSPMLLVTALPVRTSTPSRSSARTRPRWCPPG